MFLFQYHGGPSVSTGKGVPQGTGRETEITTARQSVRVRVSPVPNSAAAAASDHSVSATSSASSVCASVSTASTIGRQVRPGMAQ